MKKFLVVVAMGVFAACNGSASSSNMADSAAGAAKDAVSATADSAKTQVDSTASAAKDSINAKVDSMKK